MHIHKDVGRDNRLEDHNREYGYGWQDMGSLVV